MSVVKMLDISTVHITKSDADLLEADAAGIIAYDKSSYKDGELDDRYGWFIHVPDQTIDVEDCQYSCREAGMSEAFVNLVGYAHKQGCYWICLDRDGDDIDDLPTFEW